MIITPIISHNNNSISFLQIIYYSIDIIFIKAGNIKSITSHYF